MAEMQKKFLGEERAAWDAKDAKKLASLYAEDVEIVGSSPDGMRTIKGREEYEKGRTRSFALLSKAVPDMKWSRYRVLQNGNLLVVEWGAVGTDTGGMFGAASNRKIGWRGVSLMWFDADGRVEREHNYADLSNARRQTQSAPKEKYREPPEPPTETVWFSGAESETEKKNAELVNAAYALFEKKDDKAYVALLTEDFVHARQAAPADLVGKTAAKKSFLELTRAFPDLKLRPTVVAAFGDVVVAEYELTGTFEKAMGAMKPTRKSGTARGLDVIEMRDGKAARVTGYMATSEFARAFGLPMPPKPGENPPDSGSPKSTALRQ